MSYRRPPRYCIGCYVDSHDGHHISYNGYCEKCGIERMASAIEQVAEQRGPVADKWAQAMIRGAQRMIDRNAREVETES